MAKARRAGRGERVGQGLVFVASRLALLEAAEGGVAETAALALDDPALALPALQALAAAFALDAFEAQLLLLALGAEISPEIAAACGRCQGDPKRSHASLRLAAALFPGSEWRSFGPSGALRRWDLIELDPRPLLLDAPLRLSEFTLNFLCGALGRERGLEDVIDRLGPDDLSMPTVLPPSQAAVAKEVELALRALASSDVPARLHLIAQDMGEGLALAQGVAAALAIPADRMNLGAALAAPDHALLLRHLRREQALAPALLIIEFEDGELTPEHLAATRRLIERLPAPVLTISGQRMVRLPHAGPVVRLDLPTRDEQFAIWRVLLRRAATPLAPMLAQYRLGHAAIATAFHAAAAARGAAGDKNWHRHVSEACRAQLRGVLDGYAERIQARIGADDLILPPMPAAQVARLIHDARRLPAMAQTWRAQRGDMRGLGLAALFSGPSGSGKTTAAEAVATALDLDLYRIDLSAVISKYIGETEKQLAKVFEAGERSAAILFFDEADALFGKRTEARDSHDRFANQEIAYLLQRLESYGGVTILATNMADSLDTAFLRRFRFVIRFPMPPREQREAIWRRVFAGRVEIDALDFAQLAQLSIAGGNIENIAQRAAYLAEDAPVTMALIRLAAEEEYTNLHRIMTDEEWEPNH